MQTSARPVHPPQYPPACDPVMFRPNGMKQATMPCLTKFMIDPYTNRTVARVSLETIYSGVSLRLALTWRQLKKTKKTHHAPPPPPPPPPPNQTTTTGFSPSGIRDQNTHLKYRWFCPIVSISVSLVESFLHQWRFAGHDVENTAGYRCHGLVFRATWARYVRAQC